MKATSVEAAQVFVTHLKGKRLNRYEDERIFSDGAFLGLSQIVFHQICCLPMYVSNSR